MEAALLEVVKTINSYLSDYILIILLIGVGLWYSIKTRFVQVRCFGEGWKKLFGNFSFFGKKQEGGMTSFQALATAIAGQVGTGNIVGASGAILTGGPGAIFWMWIIAFFGMSTIYAEATCAQKTRITDAEGQIQGGPVYYIKTAFKGKGGTFLAGFFAVAAVLALGFFGAMVQSNSIASTCNTAFGIPVWVMGIVLVVLCGLVFFAKVQRLAAVVEKIVPIMAILFILGALIIIIMRIQYLPAAFGAIFYYAFCPQALIGGGLGAALKIAISQGAKRGLFSNEAGMGSTPHAHAQANVKHPHDQGVVAMIGVFIDTFVVLTLNALVIIITLYVGGGILDPSTYADGQTFTTVLAASGLGKANLAQTAFGTVFGSQVGAIFVAVCLFFFAFSTILAWNLFGKINMVWMFHKKLGKKACIIIYGVIALIFTFIGTLVSNDLVWELTDMFNQLMVIPNAIALFALTGLVVKSCKEGIALKKNPELTPEELEKVDSF